MVDYIVLVVVWEILLGLTVYYYYESVVVIEHQALL